MDVVGENEALQQFFEGKSQVLRESLNFRKNTVIVWG